MTNRLSAVIFDLDGTLIDSVPDVTAALNRMLEGFGRRQLQLDEVKTMVGWGARTMLCKAFENTGGLDGIDVECALGVYLAHYRSHPADHTHVYPGVREELARLNALGVPLGICTNKPHEMTVLVLKALNMHSHFSAICGADLLPFRKPDGRHILHVIEQLDANPADAIMVGDSDTDIRAARDARIPCIAVTYGYHAGSLLDADVVLQDFAELPRALDLVCSWREK